MASFFEEAAATFDELLRIHKLNAELIETLSLVGHWLRDYANRHNIPFPDSSSYDILINKTDILIKEIASNSPDYETFSRRKVAPNRTDEDETEPILSIYKGGLSFPQSKRECF